MLIDNHGRPINYLRLAVTDRCNLRCHYCMPEHGLEWLSRSALLSYEEMIRLCRLLANLGIDKIRITGGEPFVRKDMIGFLRELTALDGIRQVSITTNGVVTAPLVPQLKEMGIHSVNLSLDTLDRERFFRITRRDELLAVEATLYGLLEAEIPVKINAVVMAGQNDMDMAPLAALTRDLPVDVRFIEEMPFNGGDHANISPVWTHTRMVEYLREIWPAMELIPSAPSSTSVNYHIPGHKGKVGVIPAWSRTFCGTCNRIRITPQGMMKTCLYDHGALDLRDLMRNNADDAKIADHVLDTLQKRHRDGWEAEKARNGRPVEESMATIGG